MNAKTNAVYQKITRLIGDEAMKLDPGEYDDLLAELGGHIESLQDCREEETRGE